MYTLPTYESVEAITVIPNFHQYPTDLNNITKQDLVLATAGSKGVVRLWKTQWKDDPEKLPKSTSFKILSLFEQHKESAFGEKRGGYLGLLLTSLKHNLGQGNREDDSTNNNFPADKMLVVDAEHNMSFLSLIQHSNGLKRSSLLGLERTIIGHNDEILDLCIIPDQFCEEKNDHNRNVAVATNSAQIRLFDLASYSCCLLDGHTETVLCIDVSPCGRYLVSSGKDKTTRLWHLKSKKCIAIATGHTEAIGANALSQKMGRYDVTGKAALRGAGCFLVTASKDKTLKRWNLPGCKEMDDYANGSSTELNLSAFCSVRAHEKVRLMFPHLPTCSFFLRKLNFNLKSFLFLGHQHCVNCTKRFARCDRFSRQTCKIMEFYRPDTKRNIERSQERCMGLSIFEI